MTVFSDVLDKFRQEAIALFGADRELADSYNLVANTDRDLDQGWGIAVGAATPGVNPELKPILTDNYPFDIVFTRDITRTMTNSTVVNDALVLLMTDELELRKQLIGPNLLLSDSSAQLFFNGISEPTFLTPNNTVSSPDRTDASILYIISSYTVRIEETI